MERFGSARKIRAFSIMATVGLVAGMLVLSSASDALASSDPELVSAGPGGQGNDRNADASISDDGRIVAFWAFADLVPEDQNGTQDVYIRDRVAQTTTLVSVNQSGFSGNGASYLPSISSNGRWVSFTSAATDLTNDATTFAAVFVRDLQLNTTELVSSLRGAGGRGGSAISRDGRFVTYSAIPPGSQWTVYSTDRDTDTTVLVAHDPSGNPVAADTGFPSISGDGRYVAFESIGYPFLPGTLGFNSRIYVWDRMTDDLELVSPNIANYHDDTAPSISADGRFIVFTGLGQLLPTDTNGLQDVFLRDRQTQTLEMVSLDQTGNPPATGNRAEAIISGDGKLVAFTSNYGDFTTDDPPGGSQQLFVRDLAAGTTQLVSKTASGDAGNGMSDEIDFTYDGGLIAYTSEATNFLSPDTNGSNRDIFVSEVVAVVPPDPDADDDGIYDEVDTQPSTPSVDFDDGAGTFGFIVTTNGHTVTIEDDADLAEGVRIRVTGIGSQKARFQMCGWPGFVQLLPGSDATFTCASIIADAHVGDVEVTLDEAGTNIVTVPEGGRAEITELSSDSFSVENLGTTDVTVVVDGQEVTVPAGDSQEVATWDFQGFTSPVDNPDVLNVVSAGQAVPLKWRLVGSDGTPITDLTSVTVRATSLSCADGTTSDQLEEVATGSSGLHNLGNGYYQFNWKTPKGYSKSCKTLHLDVGQGVEREALFRFPK